MVTDARPRDRSTGSVYNDSVATPSASNIHFTAGAVAFARCIMESLVLRYCEVIRYLCYRYRKAHKAAVALAHADERASTAA